MKSLHSTSLLVLVLSLSSLGTALAQSGATAKYRVLVGAECTRFPGAGNEFYTTADNHHSFRITPCDDRVRDLRSALRPTVPGDSVRISVIPTQTYVVKYDKKTELELGRILIEVYSAQPVADPYTLISFVSDVRTSQDCESWLKELNQTSLYVAPYYQSDTGYTERFTVDQGADLLRKKSDQFGGKASLFCDSGSLGAQLTLELALHPRKKK